MKRCIVTDLHGVSPSLLIDRMRGHADGWAFLGDYDDPRVLKEVMGLKQDRIITIGNHDYFYAIPPKSGWAIGDKKMRDLFDLWKTHEDESEFVLDCVENMEGSTVGVRAIRNDSIGRVVYTHSIISNSFYRCLEDRLYFGSEADQIRAENFKRMADDDIRLMFRGHDHLSAILSSDLLGQDIRCEDVRACLPFIFRPGRRYVVSVGNFSGGDYAIYDDSGSVILNSEIVST